MLECAYRLEAPFLLTCAEYAAFIEANPGWGKGAIDPELHDGAYLKEWPDGRIPEGKEDHPVSYICWAAAAACAAWYGMRLPTEAEWEYAARGGLSGKKFPAGDQMNDKLANFAKQVRSTTPAGKYAANGYGLYDMAGNLFEWTADWYGPYAPGESDNPGGPHEGEYRVIRGGSWSSAANTLRVSFRIEEDPNRCGFIGIRLAADVPGPA